MAITVTNPTSSGGSGTTFEVGQLREEAQTLSAASGTVDLDNNNLTDGAYLKVTTTGNLTINQTTALDTTYTGTWYLELTNGGGHTLSLGTNILTPGGVGVSVSAGASDTDLLIFRSDSVGKSRLVEHRKSYA